MGNMPNDVAILPQYDSVIVVQTGVFCFKKNSSLNGLSLVELVRMVASDFPPFLIPFAT